MTRHDLLPVLEALEGELFMRPYHEIEDYIRDVLEPGFPDVQVAVTSWREIVVTWRLGEVMNQVRWDVRKGERDWRQWTRGLYDRDLQAPWHDL